MISYLNHINKGQKDKCKWFADPEFDSRDDLKEMSDYYGWKINKYEITYQDVIKKFENVFISQDEPYLV